MSRYRLTRRTEPLTARQNQIGTWVAGIACAAMVLPTLYLIISNLTF